MSGFKHWYTTGSCNLVVSRSPCSHLPVFYSSRQSSGITVVMRLSYLSVLVVTIDSYVIEDACLVQEMESRV
jgi:hypothetical protein